MKLKMCLKLVLALGIAAGAPAWTEEIPARAGQYGQEVATKFTTAQGLPSDNVEAVGVDNGIVYALTEGGLAQFSEGAWTPVPEDQAARVREIVAPRDSILIDGDRTLHQVAVNPNPLIEGTTEVAAASYGGLMTGTRGEGYYLLQPSTVADAHGRIWSATDVRGVAYDSAGGLWFCTPAGVAYRQEEDWRFFEGKDGLPYSDFTCAAAGPDGRVWFGTTMGAFFWDGADFQYRQGPRWLPADEVRDIAVDAQGGAWFATAAGVGLIERRPMTLWEKAQHYEQEMEKIKRTEFGYVSEVGLKNPGDTSPESIIYTDSDNDGLWTAMYGAGQCYAYAATKDPAARERAVKAFEALRFLQTVTQSGSHPAPKGYVARTILPTDGPDPNEGRMERDQRGRDEGDKLWKVYEPRWPVSEDGRWYWKSDTSSDETDGHYFFYPLFYDLVAETDEEKAAVRQVQQDLTDHLIEHGYRLVDHTGTVTRWGEFSPEALNSDENWWIERGLKSLSMLSYLASTYHMTGDQKYLDHFNKLAHEHNYLFNQMVAKIHLGVGSSNQSDDEMAIMCFYMLLRYLPDESMRNMINFSFYTRYALEEPEMNPFFNFAYAAVGRGQTYTNPFGTWPVEPWNGWLSDSMQTLTGFPLDRINWPHRNSQRLDITLLPRQQQVEQPVPMPENPTRGYRINTGKVIPVENRHFNHWNTDPWQLNYGGNGQQLASGTVYLLPYYMGLYHGFIAKD